MQQHAGIATRLGGGHQRIQHLAADAAAALAGQHRHAADLGHTGLVRQHAAGGQGQAQAVAGQRMHAVGVTRVPFQLGRNALLVDEHRLADGARFGAQRGPVAHLHRHHRRTGLEGVHHIAEGLRDGLAGLGGRVGKHIDQLAADQQRITAEHRGLQQHRGVAEARQPHADVDQVVQAGRGVVLQAALLDIEVALQRGHRRRIGQGHGAPPAADGGVDVHQVVAVEDDLLGVDLGPAHTQALEVAEVGTGGGAHGVIVQAARSASAAACWAWPASFSARPILMKSCVMPRTSSRSTGTPAMRSRSA